MNQNDRFITFEDVQEIWHTVRITDIQEVGVDRTGSNSFIRAFDFPSRVKVEEARRVKDLWVKEG